MKVVWAGTFEPEFSRNLKLARLLDLVGADVDIVRETVWPTDRLGLATGSWLRTALRAVIGYPRLLARLLFAPPPDLYLVSYPGWFDVLVVRLAARAMRRPLVFDPFISLYDTMISDRRLRADRSPAARIARLADRWSLRLADLVMADTPAQLTFYDSLAPGIEARGVAVPIGADDSVFAPAPATEVDERLVLFYGSLVPLQGVGTIVEAAAILEKEGIRTRIIGDGQDRPALEEAMRRTGAALDLLGPVSLAEIPGHVARAAVCLGIFGESEKAGRVVPHKVYECLAMGRPVITRDSPAIRSLFEDDELVTVPPADAEALAEAIRELVGDVSWREEVARNGLAAYRSRFHEAPLAELLDLALHSVLR